MRVGRYLLQLLLIYQIPLFCESELHHLLHESAVDKSNSDGRDVNTMTYDEVQKQLNRIGPAAIHQVLETNEGALTEMYSGKEFSRQLDGPLQQHYGTFAKNYGPMGDVKENQQAVWGLHILPNAPTPGDSVDAFHNYSSPWQSGPHPMWPVPPVPKGLEAVYGEQQPYLDPTPYDGLDVKSPHDIDVARFDAETPDVDGQKLPSVDFRPQVMPNAHQLEMLHRGFPLSRVQDSWLKTRGGKAFTGQPSQWSTSPYPYGRPGEQVCTASLCLARCDSISSFRLPSLS